jgi:hypothetical protein
MQMHQKNQAALQFIFDKIHSFCTRWTPARLMHARVYAG